MAMALSIKDEETDRLVRRLARIKKTSFTGAIRLAVGNEIARSGEGDFRKAVNEAQAWFRANRLENPPSEDDILGYDENGIPTQPR
jgi:antitoxin VapB